MLNFEAANSWNVFPAVCVLDLVHGADHDASRGAAIAWCRAIIAGLVLGVFVSPPCETWSIARHNMLEDCKVVPVRSMQHPGVCHG